MIQTYSNKMSIHIYQKKDGQYLYTDTGLVASIMLDVGDDKDFTLKALPDPTKLWYWVNDKWQLNPKGVQSD